jgi:DNA repair exonuclease SbcCD nuclease subunit
MHKKICIVGDPHIDNKQPVGRLDSYMESSLADLKCTLMIAQESKCDAIVFLGDMFDRKQVNAEVTSKLIQILNANDYGEPWPFKKYTLLGNHDIENTMSNLDKSSFWTLIVSGCVEYVKEVPELGLVFEHWHGRIEETITDGIFRDYDYPIVCAHAYIADQPTQFVSTSILADSFAVNPKTRLITAGHFHFEMDVMRDDNTRFVNPGSLSRRNFKIEDANKKIKVAIVEYDLEGTYLDVKYEDVYTAQPYDIIFDLDKREEVKAIKEEIKAFTKSLTEFNFDKMTYLQDPIDQVKSTGIELSLDNAIVENACRALIKLNAEKV